MQYILGIGLPDHWIAELSGLPARVYATTSLIDASRLLATIDFESVILDLQRLGLDCHLALDLMGQAPLTTRFIIVCDESVSMDRTEMAAMGIKTLQPTTAFDNLRAALPE